MKQKSIVNWIKLGDANTKSFSAVMKEKQQKWKIVPLTSLASMKLVDPDVIKSKIIQFYEKLMGTNTSSLPAVEVYEARANHQTWLETAAL